MGDKIKGYGPGDFFEKLKFWKGKDTGRPPSPRNQEGKVGSAAGKIFGAQEPPSPEKASLKERVTAGKTFDETIVELAKSWGIEAGIDDDEFDADAFVKGWNSAKAREFETMYEEEVAPHLKTSDHELIEVFKDIYEECDFIGEQLAPSPDEILPKQAERLKTAEALVDSYVQLIESKAKEWGDNPDKGLVQAFFAGGFKQEIAGAEVDTCKNLLGLAEKLNELTSEEAVSDTSEFGDKLAELHANNQKLSQLHDRVNAVRDLVNRWDDIANY